MSYLPSPYKRFAKRYSDLNEQYERLAIAFHEAGSLEERYRRLIKLGIAIGQQSEVP